MSIRSLPFTSVDGDRKIGAADFRQYWSSFATNGVIQGIQNECRCSTNGMNITIGTGVVHIQGAIAIIDAAEMVAITSVTTPRYATVVLEFNSNAEYRDIHTNVVYGTGTTLGTLTQTNTVWQMPLCTVLVPANAATLSTLSLADERKFAQLRLNSMTVDNPITRIVRTAKSPSGHPWGDVNGDGEVNNADLVALGRYLSGGGTIETDAVDFDGDGEVTNVDLVAFTRLLEGMNEGQVIERTRITYENGSVRTYWGYTDAPSVN